MLPGSTYGRARAWDREGQGKTQGQVPDRFPLGAAGAQPHRAAHSKSHQNLTRKQLENCPGHALMFQPFLRLSTQWVPSKQPTGEELRKATEPWMFHVPLAYVHTALLNSLLWRNMAWWSLFSCSLQHKLLPFSTKRHGTNWLSVFCFRSRIN